MISLNEAKTQCNIDLSFDGDDDYIAMLIDVAIQSVKNAINDISIDDITLITPLKHACLLTIANLYMNREPVAFTTISTVPYTFDFLINKYINYEN